MVQGVRMPAAHELEPLEVRFPKFDLPLLQFLKARPPARPGRPRGCWHSALHPACVLPSTPHHALQASKKAQPRCAPHTLGMSEPFAGVPTSGTGEAAELH